MADDSQETENTSRRFRRTRFRRLLHATWTRVVIAIAALATIASVSGFSARDLFDSRDHVLVPRPPAAPRKLGPWTVAKTTDGATVAVRAGMRVLHTPDPSDPLLVGPDADVQIMIELRNAGRTLWRNASAAIEIGDRRVSPVAGTTRIYNGNHPNGIDAETDAIFDGGINVGSAGPGGIAYITATMHVAARSEFNCGITSVPIGAALLGEDVPVRQRAEATLQVKPC